MFEIENTEMYGEPFAVPTPDEIVFISWFEGGEVFRSGCTWKRGNGKIFYFRPGTRPIRSISIPSLGRFCATPFIGPHRRGSHGSTAAQISQSKKREKNWSRKDHACTRKAKPVFVDRALQTQEQMGEIQRQTSILFSIAKIIWAELARSKSADHESSRLRAG